MPEVHVLVLVLVSEELVDAVLEVPGGAVQMPWLEQERQPQP